MGRVLTPGWLTLAACLAMTGAARADDAQSSPVTFSVGAASDYVFRGVSQSRNRPDVFAAADLTLERFGYLGAWASNVDFRNGTRAEYDIYGGVRPLIGPVTLDLGFVRYGYVNQPQTPRETYTEWKVAPSMALGPATFGLAYAHSDNFLGETGSANYYEVNAASSIGATPFSLSGALGRQQVKGPRDYTTWNLGVSYALNNRLGFDLRYWDTDKHGLGNLYRSKVVLGFKATFP